MLGETTHLQAIVDDLTVLTEDPHKLPPASEQVITLNSQYPALVAHLLEHMAYKWETRVQFLLGLFAQCHSPCSHPVSFT